MADLQEPPNLQDTVPAQADPWEPPKQLDLRQVQADLWVQLKLLDTKSAQGDLQVSLFCIKTVGQKMICYPSKFALLFSLKTILTCLIYYHINK